MTSLLNSLNPQASQSLMREKVERARNAHINSEIGRVVEDKIARAYGDRAAYEACRFRLGMAEDHAWNFERYGVVLLPHQMEFAAWARRCDFPDGPEELGIG